MNRLRVILPLHKAQLVLTPLQLLGDSIGAGAKHIGIQLVSYEEITREVGDDDREVLTRPYDKETTWVRFDFQVSDRTIAWYNSKPREEAFDMYVTDYVAGVADRLSSARAMHMRVA